MAIENKVKTIPGKVGNPAWRKGGSSPNPGGRPGKLEELKVSLSGMTPRAMEEINRIIRDENAKDGDKLSAIRLVFEYLYGKPSLGITVGVQAAEVESTEYTKMILNRARQIRNVTPRPKEVDGEG